MKKTLTEIVFILDRSGSMAGLEDDTIGGFNAMIAKQKGEPGEALVSTVLFDNVSVVIHDRVDIQKIEPMTRKDYYVRGCTALLDAGALDVYTTPIQMKKGRPAVMLSCICRPEQAQDMAALMLRHTTTLGVRMHNLTRRVLRRETGKVQTPYGEVDVKIAHGEGFKRVKAEFEDAARIAKEQNVSVLEVMRAAEK